VPGPLRRRVAPLSLGVVGLALLVASCGVSGAGPPSAETSPLPPAPACGTPTGGQTIVVLVSATAHEPQPTLGTGAEKLLRTAADSTDVSDGKGSKGSQAVITTADAVQGGQQPVAVPLTPRRANCEVEHGAQRQRLIDTNIDRVRSEMGKRSAEQPGLDLLAGIDNAVRGRPAGQLIIISNGLSTSGGFDLRQVGWSENPDELVAQLEQRKLLQHLLRGWHVLFTGLGSTAGAQVPLTKPARDTLTSYWEKICGAASAASCQISDKPLDRLPPRSKAEMPMIDVPGISSATGPDGRTTITLFDSVTGFAPDSAVLPGEARDLLRSISGGIAGKLGSQPDAVISVQGYVADPPDSTAAGRLQTANDRAAAVAAFVKDQLRAAGFSSPRIDAAGVGTPPDPATAIVNGAFDESTARQMRKVTITY
jgi:hypothetical protein